MTDKERFDKFKKDLPKESYAIIIKDSEHGLSEFMAYDTTEGSEVTNGYVILRGFIELIETQVDTVMMHGQAAIFRDLKVRKPETEDQPKSNGNITMVDFKK